MKWCGRPSTPQIEAKFDASPFGEVASRLYLLIDGERTVEDIIAELLEEYDVSKQELTLDIFTLINWFDVQGAISSE